MFYIVAELKELIHIEQNNRSFNIHVSLLDVIINILLVDKLCLLLY